MAFSEYLVSILQIVPAAAVLFGIPTFLVWSLFPKTGRVFCFLAVSSVFTLTIYLKPESFPLWRILELSVLVCLGLAYLSKQKGSLNLRGFFSPLRDPVVWATFGYCFLLFFFRWEPPGTDPVKWGSLAKLILEYERLPTDLRPISPVSDFGGATLGIPTWIVFLKLLSKAPIERIVNFTECLSLWIFILSLARIIRIWFPERVATLAALLSLLLFTNPQEYLAWGGTPTLTGFAAGLILLEVFHRSLTAQLSYLELTMLALGLSFGAFAHPIGIYLSGILCAVCILCFVKDNGFFVGIRNIALVGVGSLLFFSPFFLTLKFGISEAEWTEVWRWHKSMGSYLFREEHSLLYNLYIQSTTFVWNTAAWIIFVILLFSFWVEKKAAFRKPMLVMTVAIVLMILNVRYRIIPLSYLVYPDRAGTLFIVPLSLVIAWALIQFGNRQSLVRNISRLSVATILVGGGLQFGARVYPLLGASEFNEVDRQAIVAVNRIVPRDECIKIELFKSESWIPVLAFRCTVPAHPLGSNVIEDSMKRPSPTYEFLRLEETRNVAQENAVFNNGARIVTIQP